MEDKSDNSKMWINEVWKMGDLENKEVEDDAMRKTKIWEVKNEKVLGESGLRSNWIEEEH